MQRLGLDGTRSWLILTEANHVSKWPGVDLGDQDYGNAGVSLHKAAMATFQAVWKWRGGGLLVPFA